MLLLVPRFDAGDDFLTGAFCFVVAFFAAGACALDRVATALRGEVLDLGVVVDFLVAVRAD